MNALFLRTFAAAALALLGLLPLAAFGAYPERPITLIVPWGAGGGTDATARIIGVLLEKELGQPINVVNRTGGSGVVGHSAIAQAAPDGYTIGIITVEIGMMHWQALTELNGASYTPIALVNADPAGVQVAADAPYKTVNDLVAAIKANPGKLKASGTGQGGIWHLNCHSMPAVGDVMSNDPGRERAEFVLGDRDGTTCEPEFTAFVAATLLAMGYEVAVNDP